MYYVTPVHKELMMTIVIIKLGFVIEFLYFGIVK